MTVALQEQREELSRSEKWRVERDGDRDLQFTGWRLGMGGHGTGGNSGYCGDWTRGVDVAIFLTEGGKYVARVRRWSRWQGENDYHTAYVATTPKELLAFLREDAGGTLGPASKEAWEDAAENWSPLADHKCEQID